RRLHHGRAGGRRRDAQLPEHVLPRRALPARDARPAPRAGIRGVARAHASHRRRRKAAAARPLEPPARGDLGARALSREGVVADPWTVLRALTPARIALGRSGASLPTDEVLRFGVAHALARDAVHQALDADRLEAELRAAGCG